MRAAGAIIVSLITVLLIWVLGHSMGSLPAIGPLVNPVSGCWANAEPVNKNFTGELKLPSLKGKVTVWFDNRLVPHIHAENAHDIYFIQGYVHAYFRLFQMDMQTRAAAGRISEVVGGKALNFDRLQRRKGMVFGAKNSLELMESEPRTKEMLDAYTAGINQYISGLDYKQYPLEYKIIGFDPEPWTNLKSALLLKYMADDLTGYTEDIALTALRDMIPPEDLAKLYPESITGSTPVIPSGTGFEKPLLTMPLQPVDSVWSHYVAIELENRKDEGKGSNNWALSGTRTGSGAAMLCNDPHLGLNLPSLWYEVQMQTPDMNVYGVSLPGAPGVIIGFNDSISWGFTNNYRDVKDFYEVKQVAGNSHAYWFVGKQLDYKTQIEHIGRKGKPDFLDTVNYTIQGPVMYDKSFHGPDELKTPIAMCWMAHRATNELLAVYMLNRAKGYNEFVDAILNFQCPAQNMVYADKSGNIALWGQGQFVDKWKEQGRYVMNGADSAALWGQLIPMRENPHVLNPELGYVSSANQLVTDTTYPYWYNGYFHEFRAWRINQLLSGMQHATPRDMFTMQQDTYSILAQNALPIMLRNLPTSLPSDKSKYVDSLKKWNYNLSAESVAAAVFQVWWTKLYDDLWSDDFGDVPDKLYPTEERTMQLLESDPDLKYYDDRKTPQVEHLNDMVLRSFNEALDSLNKITAGTEWYEVKNTSVQHLTKLPAFSYYNLKTGGWGTAINAMKHDHGPSWRMVVQMSRDIEAYGVYPGGQSGNPGSKYYADFLPSWETGKYYRLLFLPNSSSQNNASLKYTWAIQPK